MLGEVGWMWCSMFKSLQLYYTAWHGLFCLHCCCCCSALCFKTVNPGCLFFLTVLATSLGPSPQSSTQCQQSFPCCTVCLVWLALGAWKIPCGSRPPLPPFGSWFKANLFLNKLFLIENTSLHLKSLHHHFISFQGLFVILCCVARFVQLSTNLGQVGWIQLIKGKTRPQHVNKQTNKGCDGEVKVKWWYKK